jgi:MHS family proline/betaine transporter-like MFS transporter
MSSRKIVAAGVIGNVLEWYDFAIYGYFATAIGRTFFPSDDPVAQILAAFGIFALGCVVRPIGGALFGHIGDRIGRRAALLVSMAAMAIPTFLVSVLPGYQVLGEAAPILLTLLRMIQGLSVGGEYTSSIVFVVEHAPSGRRGITGATANVAANAGVMLGSAVGALTAALMSTEALEAWGWRIPFVLGLLVGIAGLWLRRGLPDDPPRARTSRSPLLETLSRHWLLVLRIAGLCFFNAVTYFLVFVYLVTWLQLADHASPARALAINSFNMVLLLLLSLLTAWLSDRVGRKPIVMGATAFAFIAAWPLFWLLHSQNPMLELLGQFGFVLALGSYVGCQPVIMVEATPASVRCMVIALGSNLSLGVIGGLAPLAATWVSERMANDYSPAAMIMAAAAVSFLTLLTFKETYKAPLNPA